MKVFAIYDSKACAYLRPFFCPNRAVAIRSFASAATDESSDFYKYASDYVLFEIGDWDEFSGELNGQVEKVALGTALEYLSISKENGQ